MTIKSIVTVLVMEITIRFKTLAMTQRSELLWQFLLSLFCKKNVYCFTLPVFFAA